MRVPHAVAAILGLALMMAQMSLALPHHTKHAKPIQAKDRKVLTGWATRLHIPTEIQPQTFSSQHHFRSGLMLQDESDSSLFLAKYTLYKAWKWLFQPDSRLAREKDWQYESEYETIAAWNDSTPRFVAYGDSYVANNSLGVPDPSALIGFQYYNIAFWTSENGAEDNVQEWTSGTNAQRRAIIKAYNDAGIRLGVAAFGAESKPQSSGNDAIDLANKLAAFVIKYGLQGVDVDYEEYDLFEQVKATKWLIPFTRQLRSKLAREDGYYLSHAPIAPLFSTDSYRRSYTWFDQRIGDAVDFYNVQYYNQGTYTTCETLVRKSDDVSPKTSILELASVWGIPANKIVAGKPARKSDADGGDGYMTPNLFAGCLAEAAATGWNGGAMWWEYRGNLQFVLQPVKTKLGLK